MSRYLELFVPAIQCTKLMHTHTPLSHLLIAFCAYVKKRTTVFSCAYLPVKLSLDTCMSRGSCRYRSAQPLEPLSGKTNQ